MNAFIWIAVAFFSGAIPFSLLVGRLALKTDIRAYGDGNPGAFNVIGAGGFRLGLAAFLLDMAKGMVPVGLAYWFAGVRGWEMAAIALAPALGHAFSPFLRFKGGKAVAVSFGLWGGLTLWEVPAVLGVMLGYWFGGVKASGWAVIFAMLSVLAYLLLARPGGLLLAVWGGNTLLLAYKYRADLVNAPGLRPWFGQQDHKQKAAL